VAAAHRAPAWMAIGRSPSIGASGVNRHRPRRRGVKPVTKDPTMPIRRQLWGSPRIRLILKTQENAVRRARQGASPARWSTGLDHLDVHAVEERKGFGQRELRPRDLVMCRIDAIVAGAAEIGLREVGFQEDAVGEIRVFE
jgi:hypothetical protein